MYLYTDTVSMSKLGKSIISCCKSLISFFMSDCLSPHLGQKILKENYLNICLHSGTMIASSKKSSLLMKAQVSF